MASSRRDHDDYPAESVEPSTPANPDPANSDRLYDGAPGLASFDNSQYGKKISNEADKYCADWQLRIPLDPV